MSFTRANAGTWGVGDELTHTQINTIDDNAASALDKRSGQTDTLSSVVSLSGAGRIVSTVITGPNSNSSLVVSAGNLDVRVTSAVTANRTYTLSATDAVTGDVITVFCEPSFVTYEITIKDQAAATLYTLGNLTSSDGVWAQFMYVSGWRLYRYGQGSNMAARVNTLETDVGQISVLNFRRDVYSTPGADPLACAAYDSKYKKWFVAGTTGVYYSVNNGYGWSSNLTSGVQDSTEVCMSMAVDPATGTVIVTTDDNYVFRGTGAVGTGTWTKVDSGATVTTYSSTNVLFDEARSWFVTFFSGASAKVVTTPTGVTWTDRAGYGSVVRSTLTDGKMAQNQASGRIVIGGYKSIPATANLSFYTSDDGGVTWTDRGDVAHTVTTSASDMYFYLSYNETDACWLAVASEKNGGAYSSQVFRSMDDGVTWSSVATLTSGALTGLCSMGDMWVSHWTAAGTEADVVFSLDSGATWYPVGIFNNATITGAVASPTQLIFVGQQDVFPGFRVGMPASAAIT